MKHILWLLLLTVTVQPLRGQESYFQCNELTVFLTGGSVTIQVPNRSGQEIGQKIMDFIKARHYVFKPYYSKEKVIAFRDFAMICNKSTCGSDLIARNIFYLNYGPGFVKISLDNMIYSSFYGGELLINDNDDVASKNDVPFGPYEFQIPEQYSDEYPESIYTFNKRGKVKVKNPEVQKVILDFYNQYITDFKSFIGQ